MKVLLEELHNVQNKFGYLPEAELERIALEYNMPRAELYGVITFYSRFYLQPVPKYVVRVCKSVSCSINEASKVLEALNNYLELGDGLFMLETVECLGQCGHGPVMTVNDKVYGNLTPEKAIEIIEAYRSGG
jgi:NADH-quinone oxidoreductase subunit E